MTLRVMGIIIDGSQAPQGESSWFPERYERAVERILSHVMTSPLAGALIPEIVREVRIMPHPEPRRSRSPAAFADPIDEPGSRQLGSMMYACGPAYDPQVGQPVQAIHLERAQGATQSSDSLPQTGMIQPSPMMDSLGHCRRMVAWESHPTATMYSFMSWYTQFASCEAYPTVSASHTTTVPSKSSVPYRSKTSICQARAGRRFTITATPRSERG